MLRRCDKGLTQPTPTHGHITHSEADLIRAICSGLDNPIPMVTADVDE